MHTDIAIRASARRGLLFVVSAGVLWGTSGVATRAIYGLVEISPITVAALRLALGAPMLWAALRWTLGHPPSRVARADFAWMLLAGAALGLSQALYFAAIARIGVAIATLVTICTAPVLVSLLSALLLRERLTLAVGGALACALVGTVLLVGVGPRSAGPQLNVTLEGALLALGAACGFSTFILVSRLLANRYHPLQSIAIAVSAGAALLVAVSAITLGVTVRYSFPAWALFLYLGLVPTALAYGLFFHGMRSATATVASIASLAEPLTSTGLALLIFGEQLGPLGLPGTILLISTLAFLYRNGDPAS